jgi:hypothetical protein
MIEVALTVLVLVALVTGATFAVIIAAKLARIERRLHKFEIARRLENDRRMREMLKAIPPRAELRVAAE